MQSDRRKEASRWFAAMRRGLCSTEEHAAFEVWQRDPDNRAAFASVEATWRELEFARAPVQEAAAREAANPRRDLRALVAASIVLAAVALGLAMPPMLGTPGEQIETAIGEQRSVTLADGSIVHLSVATRLRHHIDGTVREIDLLEGQAEFVVAKDPDRPFVVRAAAQRIVAVGTRFDVSARDGQVGIAVREGVVAVSKVDPTPQAAWPTDATMLHPGDAVASDGKAVTPVRHVPAERISEWRDRVLNYERVPIKTVVRDLGLYFPDKIVIEDTGLADRRVTLRLEITDRATTLRTMAFLLSLQLTRRGNTFVLSSAPTPD